MSNSNTQRLELITTSGDDWQIEVIEQINRADAIIVHLAAKASPDARPAETIERQMRIQTGHSDDFNYNPVQEFGTGHGVLRELAYCQQAGLLHKVIALMPREMFVRLKSAMSVLEQAAYGQWYRRTFGGFIATTPRLSANDQVLRELKRVHSMVVYPKFGTLSFHLRMRWSLRRCLAVGEQPFRTESSLVRRSDNVLLIQPIRLPPDNELKNLRFTPPHLLTAVPRSEIVELSLAEVQALYPEVHDEPLKCPRCGHGSEAMFWYQYGLTPQFSRNAGTYMRCQYCGNDEYLP